jgi:magnesium chelatase subunit H
MALLKRLRGKNGKAQATPAAGAQQMAMLRRMPKILRFIPGTAQDVRAYFLTAAVLAGGSDENIAQWCASWSTATPPAAREALRGQLKAPAPVEYPEVGVYHPRMKGRIADKRPARLPRKKANGTVGCW